MDNRSKVVQVQVRSKVVRVQVTKSGKAVKRDKIIGLYRRMPGAPPPPRQDGEDMWDDVEGNQHWLFCEAIVNLMSNKPA